jgi:hypothetical protein
MVIVVGGGEQSRASAVDAALAPHLGWPIVSERDQAAVTALLTQWRSPFPEPADTPLVTTSPRALAALIAVALGRRQHLILVAEARDVDRGSDLGAASTCSGGPSGFRNRGDARPARVAGTKSRGADLDSEPALIVDRSDPDDILAQRLVRELGL